VVTGGNAEQQGGMVEEGDDSSEANKKVLKLIGGPVEKCDFFK
jgi:hypothetical protein